MAMDLAQALAGITALAGLPQTLITELAALSGIQRIGKGSILFREGERAHYVYGLVEGTATLASGTEHGETIADFMMAGDLILIPPALLDQPYMVTAQAASDLLVVMIPAADFRRLAEADLGLSVALNRLLSAHWRLLLRHLMNAKTHNADARLKNYLVELAGKMNGPARLILPGSKKELAAHLGVTPETLSRSFKRLSGLGVSTNGSEVQVKDLLRLTPVLAEMHPASHLQARNRPR